MAYNWNTRRSIVSFAQPLFVPYFIANVLKNEKGRKDALLKLEQQKELATFKSEQKEARRLQLDSRGGAQTVGVCWGWQHFAASTMSKHEIIIWTYIFDEIRPGPPSFQLLAFTGFGRFIKQQHF